MTDPAPRRALLVRLSSIGDVVHTLPAYMALRRAWPETLLGWAVEPTAALLVRRLPGPLRVHVLDLPAWRRPWRARGLAQAPAALRELARTGYEVALDFQGLLKSAVVARLSGARVWGLAPPELREPAAARLYHATAAVPPGCHVIDRGLHLAAAVGAAGPRPALPRLWDAADAAYVDDQLQRLGVGPFVALHAFANWVSKGWPALRYARVGEALARRAGLAVLWVWGPGEGERARSLARDAGPGNHACFPTSLTQLAALLGRARLFVGGDSAPLHLAVATGTPAVALFGPTDPARNGPVAPEDEVVVRRLPCSFCWSRRCPLGTRRCMEELTPEAVLEAALRRLERAGAGDPGEAP